MKGNINCLVLPFFILFTLSSVAQNGNSCGVKAVLSPNGDSIVTSPTAVYFQSVSINATDYRLIIDQYQLPMNAAINWGIQPGLTTVKLVAYNGTCTDTAVAYYFNPGQFPSQTDNSRRLYGYANRDHMIADLIHLQTGGYVLAGYRNASSFLNEPQQGVLIKTKEEGCVEWGRKISAIPGVAYSEIKKIKQCIDGGFFILSAYNANWHIAKLDVNGNLQWSKILLPPTGNIFLPSNLETLPDGGIAITGGIYTYLNKAKAIVLRLDNIGNIVWQKEYDYNFSSFTGLGHILFKDNYLYAGGSLSYYSSTSDDAFLTKVDWTTGQTIWTKKYTSANGPITLSGIVDDDSMLMVNIFTATGLTNVPGIGGYMRLNTSGNVASAAMIGESYIPNSLQGPYVAAGSNIIRSSKSYYILSSGFTILSLQPGIAYYTKQIKIDSIFQIPWVQTLSGLGQPRFYVNAPAPDDGVAIGGLELGSALSPNSLGTLLSLRVIDSAGGNQNAYCNFGNQPYIIAPQTVSFQNIQWISDQPSSIIASNSNLPVSPFYPEMRFKCPDYVDSCSYLKLNGPQSICNLNNVYTYQAHKNKACGQPTVWRIPQGLQMISKTDNDLTVRFPAFGRYVIYGNNPLSCVPVEDSIVIIAESKTPPLYLGPDTSICPNNNLILHAGSKFVNYQWQDNSTDSILTLSAPGEYWVRVTDSCDNILSDTIKIALAPAVPIDIGTDRTKCNNDTIKLSAPLGFLNYTWSPNYNISSTTSQAVVVNPITDTSYFIKAEKTPGCFAFDTIRIKVYTSPAINLGPDTSICIGDTLQLNAGTAFSQYTWNNGSSNQQIQAFTKNTYSVIGTTPQGCTSYDTLKIVNVYPLPVIDLNKDTVLCAGTSRVLDAGNGFSSYIWSNGSTSSKISVNAVGSYSVTVTDTHSCKNSDTSVITTIVPLPTAFLPVDTSICSYGKLELKSLSLYKDYLWNTNATSPSITVTTPGLYWLQVADNNNCKGKDSILVNLKECMTGFYIPSAFTPNNDGKNDIFRPLLFGNIKQYKFTIYNRWGKIVFQTEEIGKGWDGISNGIQQDPNVFVWTCIYQLEGEKTKMEKGTVMLIR